MNKRTKWIILAVALGQILLVLGLLALPNVVLAIPGRYRVALSDRSPFLSEIAEEVIHQVAPAATALPAPNFAAGERPQITIPAVSGVSDVSDEPTIAPSPTSRPTLSPTEVVDETETEEAAPVIPTSTPEPTETPQPTPVPTMAPLPAAAHIEGIQRIQQAFNNCGPANLTQVLNWHGNPTTQEEAAAYLKPNPEDRNVSPWQLSDYVNDFTSLKSTVHSNGNLQMLKQFIANDLPVVIEKGYEPNSPGAQGWFGHYLTMFGYDDELQVFYGMDTYLTIANPSLGQPNSYESIEKYWQHFNNTFYVIYEPSQEELVHQILGPELLDPLLMWEAAAVRAQEDLDENPENAFAWFNLGTSLTRLGERTGNGEFYESGADAFDEARRIGLPPRMLWYEFRIYIAYMKVGRYQDMIDITDTILAEQGGQNVEETYLYRGHAMSYLGNIPEAVAAYQRALQLNETFYPAQIALDSLS
jgi:hypothetical protein